MLKDATLKKYDPLGMHKVYDKWPQIAQESWESIVNPIHLGKVDHIVFAGMGGSGAIGDVFNAIFSKTNIHVTLVKGYLLPNTVDKNTLVVCTSISGNTVETLSILKQIKNLTCKKIAVSSGGKMEELCKNSDIKYFKIPLVHSPRGSFTAFLYTMLKILKDILPLTNKEIIQSINELKKLQKIINSNELQDSNPAIDIANWIIGIPLVLYPQGFQAVATRFKNSLQENAKSHVIIEDVIEFCHNGIVSLEGKCKVFPILIEGKDDHPKTKERWVILKEFLKTNNINYKEIHSGEGSILSKLVVLIYLLDYATIYKAVTNEINPSLVKSIDFVKQRL